MAEAVDVAPSGESSAAGDPLAALRARGAEHADPVRFRFLEALARRVPAQQGEARRFLDLRLAQAIDEYAGRFAQAQGDARARLAVAAARHPDAADDLQKLFDAGDFGALRRFAAGLENDDRQTPLADLCAHLAQRVSALPAGGVAESIGTAAAPAAELKSLRYFRETWSRLSVDQQLAEALAQGPENAGPLNAHLLVLRAFERMRDLSPDYLNRFMAYADALLWLDQANSSGVPTEKSATPGEGGKKRKNDRGGSPPRQGGDERSAKR